VYDFETCFFGEITLIIDAELMVDTEAADGEDMPRRSFMISTA